MPHGASRASRTAAGPDVGHMDVVADAGAVRCGVVVCPICFDLSQGKRKRGFTWIAWALKCLPGEVLEHNGKGLPILQLYLNLLHGKAGPKCCHFRLRPAMRWEESEVISIRSIDAHNSLVRGLVDPDCTSPPVIRSRGLPRPVLTCTH